MSYQSAKMIIKKFFLLRRETPYSAKPFESTSYRLVFAPLIIGFDAKLGIISEKCEIFIKTVENYLDL